MRTVRSEAFADRRCALIVGHPGHELRVWGWMRAARPIVAVLTDGGGHLGRSRLPLSQALCDEAGARASRWFGMTTDAAVYRAILDRDVDFFLSIADRLADMLIAERIEWVAGDASEGYNPAHDICRLVVNRAVRRARGTQAVSNYAFGLVGSPVPEAPGEDWVQLVLTPAERQRKVDAGRRYAAEVGGTLLGELNAMLEQFGATAFAHEYFVPVPDDRPADDATDVRPFYETYGERQVAAGIYTDVIRFREHMAPLARALEG